MFVRLALALTFSLAPLLARLADEWRPAPRPVRSEWCCQHIWLPAQTSAQPGRFELVDHAYLREPLDSVDDIECKELILVAVPQVGKTELERAIILSQGEVDRAPTMFAGPDYDYVMETRQKVYAMAEASPAVRDRVPPRHRRNDRAIDLERAYVYLAFSGSTQRLSGRSCRVVLVSEADRWQHPIDLAFQRTKAFRANSTVVVEGSPVGTESTISDYYAQSDRRTYHLRCPHCGHWQALRFFPHTGGAYDGCGGVVGLQEGERWLTPEEGRRTASYLCEKGCWLDDEDIRGAVPAGVWVPEGCRVTKTGRVAGEPTYPGRRRGYHLWALYSPATGIGDCAEAYLRARRQVGGLISFWNDWLGLPAELPEIDLAVVSAQEVRERIGESRKGLVPEGTVCVTAGIDTARRRCHWTAIAWQPDGRGRIFDYGHFALAWERLGSRESLLQGLRRFAAEAAWPIEGQPDRTLAVSQAWIDSSYSEHTEAVYAVCEALNRGLSRGEERWRPLKGWGTGWQQSRYTAPTKLTKEIRYIGPGFHLSWLQKSRVLLVHVDSDRYKSHLHECLKRPAEEPESLTLYHGLPGEHEEFSNQLTAEVPVEQNGQIKWERVNRQNHWLDSTYAALAAGRFALAVLAGKATRAKQSNKWWNRDARRR